MTPEEANNLMQVMNNRINQLTQQNMILESRVMTLTSAVETLNKNNDTDGGLNYEEKPSIE
jgi:prefoldin subunit 5